MYHYEMDEAVLKREKAAARELRQSRWWQNLIANHGKCHYCGIGMKKEDVTMDHVVPMLRGGRSVKGNVVMACKPCNNAKKDQLLMDWNAYREPESTSAATAFHQPSDQ